MAEPGHYNYLINGVESVRKPGREGGQVSIEAPLHTAPSSDLSLGRTAIDGRPHLADKGIQFRNTIQHDPD